MRWWPPCCLLSDYHVPWPPLLTFSPSLLCFGTNSILMGLMKMQWQGMKKAGVHRRGKMREPVLSFSCLSPWGRQQYKPALASALISLSQDPSPLAWRPDFPGAPREAHWLKCPLFTKRTEICVGCYLVLTVIKSLYDTLWSVLLVV